MTFEDLKTLVEYHYWARDRVLEAAELLPPDLLTRDLGSSFKSVRDTLVHTYAAEWAWCSRWKGVSPSALPAPDLFPEIATLRSKWHDLETAVRAVIEQIGPLGLNQAIHYKMINGDDRSSIFWQMVQHVVNHASYHRGQVTTMIRQLGAAPPQSMDLITFYRLRS
jgi:uncharacterized damage-inducible protein DinB